MNASEEKTKLAMNTEAFTNKRTEIRTAIDGSKFSVDVVETNKWQGTLLGQELTTSHSLQTVDCDHYESADDEGIEVERGFWVKKSLVKRLVWENCGFGATVRRVEFARPL